MSNHKRTPQPPGPEGAPVDGDTKAGKLNPSHDTQKTPEEPPRGGGDGELMEQPDSTSEARDPGAD